MSYIARVFISMLSDYGFKRTFGNPYKTLFLRKAIQALIKSKHEIIHIELDRNETSGKTKKSRSGLFDVSCRDAVGNIFIIEVQLDNLNNFSKRSTFYATQRYGAMAGKGDFKFTKIKKIYVISILNGRIYKNLNEWHHIGCLRNQHGEFMSDEITQIVVELGKWNKKPEKIVDDIDKLIYLMKMTHKLKVADDFTPPEFLKEGWIQEALRELRMSDMDPVQRTLAEREIVKTVYELDQIKIRAEEKQKADEAVRKANEAVQKLEEAEQKLEDAEKTQQKLKSSAIKLLKRGDTPEDVADITEIPIEQVLEIQQQINKDGSI